MEEDLPRLAMWALFDGKNTLFYETVAKRRRDSKRLFLDSWFSGVLASILGVNDDRGLLFKKMRRLGYRFVRVNVIIASAEYSRCTNAH